MDQLFNARQALIDLLQVRGDFRPNAKLRGESLLGSLVLKATYPDVNTYSEQDTIAVLQATTRMLFNAKG